MCSSFGVLLLVNYVIYRAVARDRDISRERIGDRTIEGAEKRAIDRARDRYIYNAPATPTDRDRDWIIDRYSQRQGYIPGYCYG